MRLFHRDTVVVQLALPLLEPEPDAALADLVTLQLADPMLTLTVPVIVIVALGVRSDSVAVAFRIRRTNVGVRGILKESVAESDGVALQAESDDEPLKERVYEEELVRLTRD